MMPHWCLSLKAQPLGMNNGFEIKQSPLKNFIDYVTLVLSIKNHSK